MECHECNATHAAPRVVLTGGPDAGKTAILELIRQSFCRHVRVLPEAATIVFGGGFPRQPFTEARRAAQCAIYHVQRALEAVAVAEEPTLVVCDRGTVDGLAYWPGEADEFWSSVGTTMEAELGRYNAVIHLRTPKVHHNHQNPARTTSATTVLADARIQQAWARHPRRFVVESSIDVIDKAAQALRLLRNELPECCKRHCSACLAARE